MLKSIYFVSRYMDLLNSFFKGKKLLHAYSHQKNIIHLVMTNGILKIDLNSDYPILLLEKQSHNPKQTVRLFQVLEGKSCQSFEVINEQRLIKIRFDENYHLYINLYSGKCGMSLYQNEIEIKSIKVPVELTATIAVDFDSAFSNLLKEESIFLKLNRSELIQLIMNSDKCYFYGNETEFKLTLIPIQKYEQFYNIKQIIQFNLVEISVLLSRKKVELVQHSIKNQLMKAIRKRKKEMERSLVKIEEILSQAIDGNINQIKANLLMANLNLIQKGASKVSLQNLFEESATKIDISLDPKKSAVVNAHDYYRKAALHLTEKMKLESRQQYLQKEANDIDALYTLCINADNAKKLEKVKNECIRRKLILAETNKEQKIQEKQNYNAYEFTLDGYKVLIGKDSKSNDFISCKLAKPNDYWFHVHGSPGSHVLLPWSNKKVKPDKQLLEKVASLTAYYSKQKNAGTVAVIYTLAKYVRKPKGATAGTVTVSQEKALLVKPKALEDL